jgi:hypothetical protein
LGRCTIDASFEIEALGTGTTMDFSKPPEKRTPVFVTEVGTRDGFQAEERFIDTAVKAGSSTR